MKTKNLMWSGSIAGARLLALRHADDFGTCSCHSSCCFCIFSLEERLEAFHALLVVVSRVDCARQAPSLYHHTS